MWLSHENVPIVSHCGGKEKEKFPGKVPIIWSPNSIKIRSPVTMDCISNSKLVRNKISNQIKPFFSRPPNHHPDQPSSYNSLWLPPLSVLKFSHSFCLSVLDSHELHSLHRTCVTSKFFFVFFNTFVCFFTFHISFTPDGGGNHNLIFSIIPHIADGFQLELCHIANPPKGQDYVGFQ